MINILTPPRRDSPLLARPNLSPHRQTFAHPTMPQKRMKTKPCLTGPCHTNTSPKRTQPELSKPHHTDAHQTPPCQCSACQAGLELILQLKSNYSRSLIMLFNSVIRDSWLLNYFRPQISGEDKCLI